jgi:hypothetical protein
VDCGFENISFSLNVTGTDKIKNPEKDLQRRMKVGGSFFLILIAIVFISILLIVGLIVGLFIFLFFKIIQFLKPHLSDHGSQKPLPLLPQHSQISRPPVRQLN